MSSPFFETKIEFLKGVGPQRAELLRSELGIYRVEDLLQHYPFRYVDRTRFYKVNEINADLPYIQIRGKLIELKELGEARSRRLVGRFRDETGELELVWFAGLRWVKTAIRTNVDYVLFGRPNLFNKRYNIVHPELEPVSDENTLRTSALQAVYPSSEKLNARSLDSKGLGRLIKTAIAQMPDQVSETLSVELVHAMKLLPRREAIVQIHAPSDPELLRRAEFRLKFEELFYIQLRMQRLKKDRNARYQGPPFSTIGSNFNSFYKEHIPFELTGAQKRVIREIRQDVAKGSQMNRLLQGDVGSGKTLVALMSMLMAIDNGYQAALMAPTEILATQHYQNISRMLAKMPLKVALLTGSTRTVARREIAEQLQSGELHILIGTHALIEKGVQFSKLGLVVIDEQHRFGVEQRSKLWAKGDVFLPHILIMTATPIPRTLAMTLYGDLETSIIDELPPGRTPIKTFHYFDSAKPRIYQFMREEIALGRQVYLVYPLIEESETLDLKNLQEGYEQIVREFPDPKYKVSMVHGRMKAKEKEHEMRRFKDHETHIMVATTVIEVGVDVPNASVMIIESAERFGLSQLHQLRGRVGRGAEKSYCILVSGDKLSTDSRLRLDTMVRSTDGFEIADVDLRLRGHGDLEGKQQSGQVNLRLANLAKDGQLVQLARQAVLALLEQDPKLEAHNHHMYVDRLRDLNAQSGNWSRIS